MTALELAGKIVSCIDAKKGEDIKLLDVHDRTTLEFQHPSAPGHGR